MLPPTWERLNLKELYTKQAFCQATIFIYKKIRIKIYYKNILFWMTCHFLKNFNVYSFQEDSCFRNPNKYFLILESTEGQKHKWEIYLWGSNQGRILNPVEHLWWSLSAKFVDGLDARLCHFWIHLNTSFLFPGSG